MVGTFLKAQKVEQIGEAALSTLRAEAKDVTAGVRLLLYYELEIARPVRRDLSQPPCASRSFSLKSWGLHGGYGLALFLVQ